MQLKPPIDGFSWHTSVSQLFGVNKETYEPRFGDPGHQGIDIKGAGEKMGYGTPVKSAHLVPVQCLKTFVDSSLRTNGHGVHLAEGLPNGDVLETLYWHLSDILVKAGDLVEPSTTIGLMGNTGFVLPSPSQNCPHCGTHLHFAARLWRNGVTVFKDYKNGWINPVPLLYRPGDRLGIRFLRDLVMGATGDDVAWLQTILQIEGFAEDYQAMGYFGPKTFRSVQLFQEKHGISPTAGQVGPKTRNWLSANYSV